MPSADELLASARTKYTQVTAADFEAECEAGALVVDIRPDRQRQDNGELDGAVVIDRNVLEWRLDLQSAYKISEVTGYEQRIIIVCNEGFASSLAAAELIEIGLVNTTDLSGGFQALLAARRESA